MGIVIAIVNDTHYQQINQLNTRGLIKLERVTEKGNSHILGYIEGNNDISHLIFDIHALKNNVEVACDLISRLKSTKYNLNIIVITELDENSITIKDIRNLGVTDVLFSSGALLKKELNEIFIRDNLYPQISINVPIQENQEKSERIDKSIVPPSLVTRQEAKSTMIPKKPPTSLLNKALTIAVAGAFSRIGTTTQAMQIALYLKGQDESVAIIQQNNCANSLTDFLEVYEHELKSDNHVIINGIDLYTSGQSISIAKQRFRYLVCDYGEYCSMPDQSSFMDKDIKVIVSGVMPWETKNHDMIFQYDDGSIRYIFSFTAEQDQETVKQLMGDSADKTFFAKYTPDMWQYCGNDFMYQSITSVKTKLDDKKESTRKKFNISGLRLF